MWSSCSPLYVPSLRTLNHLSSKQELNTSATIDWSGFEGRAAFSATNHVMVHGGFSKSIYGLLNERDTLNVGGMEGSYNHRMVEIGVGYYGKILGAYTEFEGGFSRGQSDAFEDIPSDPDNPSSRFYPSRVINSSYNRLYVTGGIKIHGASRFRVGAIMRLSAVKFTAMESESSGFAVDISKPFLYLEPAFDLQYDFNNVPLYFFGNLGFCRNASSRGKGRSINSYGARPEVWRWSHMIGVGLHLRKLKRNK